MFDQGLMKKERTKLLALKIDTINTDTNKSLTGQVSSLRFPL